MEFFRLIHPPDRLIICNRPNCEDIADYLEVNEQGAEDFACAAHTRSERHASVLPRGVPNCAWYESRPASLPVLEMEKSQAEVLCSICDKQVTLQEDTCLDANGRTVHTDHLGREMERVREDLLRLQRDLEKLEIVETAQSDDERKEA